MSDTEFVIRILTIAISNIADFPEPVGAAITIDLSIIVLLPQYSIHNSLILKK